ncbi:hypothetical protein J4729_07505 [Leisingera sp. HS039]|uniref:hypothetical protein n=1 Tax=Leisingera sp. HS039 TaxID=2818496 RepID=UPI001B39CF59|nr:hypothetical protein [Leisingera sp. HS039]MBQ4824395.1 hypothetical protein [Leisingera sp. HS039]
MPKGAREYRTIIVHGPAGCGKSHHGKDLAHALGCREVIDGWAEMGLANGFLPPVTPGALHLTSLDLLPARHRPPEGALVLSFDAAMAAAFVVGAV